MARHSRGGKRGGCSLSFLLLFILVVLALVALSVFHHAPAHRAFIEPLAVPTPGETDAATKQAGVCFIAALAAGLGLVVWINWRRKR